MKRKLIVTSIILLWAVVLNIPAAAEDLEETVKYKPPTMAQTVDFIAGIMLDFVDFEPGECMLTTRKFINNTIFTYRTPVRKLDPSPAYVKTRLNCVDVAVPGNKNIIIRTGRDNKEEMKNKVNVCADNRESAGHLATAMRYLIDICGGDACVDCPPFPWQRR